MVRLPPVCPAGHVEDDAQHRRCALFEFSVCVSTECGNRSHCCWGDEGLKGGGGGLFD